MVCVCSLRTRIKGLLESQVLICASLLTRDTTTLHKKFLRKEFTPEDDQTEAPLSVPQSTASQQHLVIVQGVGLSIQSQAPFELV